MTPPPAPAALIGAGLAWNLFNSRTGRTTISRWACKHKKIAVPIAVIGGAWVSVHWVLYVLPESVGGSA